VFKLNYRSEILSTETYRVFVSHCSLRITSCSINIHSSGVTSFAPSFLPHRLLSSCVFISPFLSSQSQYQFPILHSRIKLTLLLLVTFLLRSHRNCEYKKNQKTLVRAVPRGSMQSE
jgi:hypothetical protein